MDKKFLARCSIAITILLGALHASNETQKDFVYQQCLSDNQYHELDERLAKVFTKPSIQRLQFRKAEIEAKCHKLREEFTPL